MVVVFVAVVFILVVVHLLVINVLMVDAPVVVILIVILPCPPLHLDHRLHLPPQILLALVLLSKVERSRLGQVVLVHGTEHGLDHVLIVNLGKLMESQYLWSAHSTCICASASSSTRDMNAAPKFSDSAQVHSGLS